MSGQKQDMPQETLLGRQFFNISTYEIHGILSLFLPRLIRTTFEAKEDFEDFEEEQVHSAHHRNTKFHVNQGCSLWTLLKPTAVRCQGSLNMEYACLSPCRLLSNLEKSMKPQIYSSKTHKS